MAEQLLKLRVTLKGRPVRAYSFKKECVTVGRNPESDVFLDNPGISRDHCKLEQTPSGLYLVHDLDSANGVFVNEVQVARQPLMNNDVLRIG
ncbi:MAG: FHA domain-containing protein, partial [Candidatus Eisenbacteria bacterium]